MAIGNGGRYWCAAGNGRTEGQSIVELEISGFMIVPFPCARQPVFHFGLFGITPRHFSYECTRGCGILTWRGYENEGWNVEVCRLECDQKEAQWRGTYRFAEVASIPKTTHDNIKINDLSNDFIVLVFRKWLHRS